MVKFQHIIKDEISLFDKRFKNVLSTKASLLYKVTNYIRKNSGKKIRPICTILGSGLVNSVTEKTYRAAILIELLHTETLVHDDIVDDAHVRRHKFSINAIWKNKIAVLTGDYFLAKGLKLAVLNKDYDILDSISGVVEKIVEGELIQIEKTKKLNLTKEDYFKIIKLKTASLFECAFYIGGLAVESSKNNLKRLSDLGLIIGTLFQVKDDVLDYSTQNGSGKQFGNDIKEGKINLPLLYVLKKISLIEKNKVFRILRKKTNTLKEIYFVSDLVIENGGIEQSEKIIEENYNNAFDLLNDFEEGKYKNTIKEVLNFLKNRKK